MEKYSKVSLLRRLWLPTQKEKVFSTSQSHHAGAAWVSD
jgi:hypothetical protein